MNLEPDGAGWPRARLVYKREKMFVIVKTTPTKIEVIGPFANWFLASDYLHSPRFRKRKYQKYYIREVQEPKPLCEFCDGKNLVNICPECERIA